MLSGSEAGLELAVTRLQVLDFANQASKLCLPLLLGDLMLFSLLTLPISKGCLSLVTLSERFSKELDLSSVIFQQMASSIHLLHASSNTAFTTRVSRGVGDSAGKGAGTRRS